MTPSATLEMEAMLREIVEKQEDENMPWHAQDGLDHRTWEGKWRRR